MKRLGWLLGLLGLAVGIALVVWQGWASIFGVIDRAGWILLWLVPFHALPLLLDVLGWRTLLQPRDPRHRAGVPVLFWIAAVREAVNRLLPVANVGGEVVGIRLVTWRGIAAAAGAASIVMEVVLTLVNQYFFVGLGLVLLIGLTASSGALFPVLVALLFSLPLPFVLIALLRYGRVFERIEAIGRKLLGGASRQIAALLDGAGLDREVRALCGAPWRLVAAGGWQFVGLVVGSFENWLALRWLGHPIGIADAVAYEATTQALRHIFFVVPAGIGVQEGGLMLIGDVLGLPPDVSLALSLVKRMREVVFGVPALIAWQWTEARRLHTMWRSGSGDDAARLHDTGP